MLTQELAQTLKDDIANAVQLGVSKATLSDGYHQCIYYAAASTIIARHFTGNEYKLVGGRIGLVKIKTESGLSDWIYNTSVSEECEAFLPLWVDHFWSERTNASEIIDLSSRHNQRYFKIRWDVLFEYSPEYVWCNRDELPRFFRQWYSADEDITRDAFRLLKERHHREKAKKTLQYALDELEKRGYRARPEEKQLWPAEW